MATPSFVAVSAEVETGGNPTFTLPAGWAVDDILVVIWQGGGTLTLVGWTLIATQGTLKLYWKRAVLGEGNPTFVNSAGNSTGRMIAVRDCVATGNPVMQSALGGGQFGVPGNSTIQTAPSVTTTESDEFIIHCLGGVGTTSTVNLNTEANAALASFAVRSVDSYTTGRSCLATGVKSAAGATGVMQNTVALGDASALNGITVALGQSHTLALIAGAMSGLDGTANMAVTGQGPIPTFVNGAMSGLDGSCAGATVRLGRRPPLRIAKAWVYGVDGTRRFGFG